LKITHCKTPVEYNKNLVGLQLTKESLLNTAEKLACPELLSFIPDIDVEQMTYRGTEVCSHILYANLRHLLRFPSLGIIDQKQKYSSIYAAPRTTKQFFNGQYIKAINYRTVAEIMLLYNLSAIDLEKMSRWCCLIESEHDEKQTDPDFKLLESIYTKKQVAQIIRSCIDKQAAFFLPAKLLKGQEYISYADFLHTFRAIGQNPFRALESFAHKKIADFTKLNAPIRMFKTFKTEPLDTVEVLTGAVPAIKNETVSPGAISHGNENVSRGIQNPTVSNNESVEPAPEVKTLVKEDDVASKKKTFGEIITGALSPISRKRRIYLPKNIYILREGIDGHKNSMDRDFDNLFAHSGITNLDIFNYLVRISCCYNIPMSKLIFEEIQYGKYMAQKTFRVKEYSLPAIASALSLQSIKNNMLFQTLSCYPPQRFDEFGCGTVGTQQSTRSAVKGPAPVAETSQAPHTPANNPAPAPAKEQTAVSAADAKKERGENMNVDLKIRVCYPCDANSWENDNPDRTAPGFYWGAADTDLSKTAKEAVGHLMNDSCFDPMVIRASLAEVITLPFKAQLIVTSNKGFRVSYDLL